MALPTVDWKSPRVGLVDQFPRAPLLESWYRDELPKAELDISSSGVQPYALGELRALLDIRSEELDALVLEDGLSLGGQALRAAIADRYAPGAAERVMVTHGSSEAIALLLSVLLKPGERVVVVDPVYHSLRSYPELMGCDVVRVPVTAFGQADSDGPPELCEGTRALIVNFPHNPTGVSLSSDGIRRLARRCAAIGALLIWDGAMEELPMTGAANVREPRAEDHVIRFGTLSKAFGLPGLRVGWSIAPPEILKATFAIRDRTTLFLSPLVELVAEKALSKPDVLIDPRLRQARLNLARLVAWAREHQELVGLSPPAGGVCALLELRGETDTEPFCRQLLAECGVLLVPGRAFDVPGAVRIGYGGCSRDFGEALGRLSYFLRAR